MPEPPHPMLRTLLDHQLPHVTRGDGPVGFSAVVLAAGAGRRLRPLTDRICKPLAPVLNVPLLYWAVSSLRAAGANTVAVNVHNRAEQLEAAATHLHGASVPVRIVREELPTGPAGGITACRRVLPPSPCYVVVNGDAATTLDISAMVADHLACDADLTVFAQPVPDPTSFGTLRLRDREILGLAEKSATAPAGSVVNCGIYVLSERALYDLDPPPRDEEYDFRHVVPQLRSRGRKILAHLSPTYWNDVGTADALVRTNLWMLDRDPVERVAQAESKRLGLWIQGAAADVPPGVTVEGRALVAEGVRAGEAVYLKNSVVGAGASIGPGARVHNCVVLPHACVPADAHLDDELVF